MHRHRPLIVLLFAVLGTTPLARGQEPEDVLPPGDSAPVLRVDAAGPLSYVSSLAFSPDGEVLYAAGWDKVVHVWARRGDRLEYAREAVLRVPVGAGLDGGLNAIAVSPDGEWLAAAGRSLARNIAGHRESGWILPGAAMLPPMRLDSGTIYLFHTRTREVRLLRGHAGPVLSLAFSPGSRNSGPILISAADEWDEKRQSQVGALRAWDAVAGREIGKLSQVPDGNRGWQPLPASQGQPPELAVFRTGPAPSQVRVAFTWDDHFTRRIQTPDGRSVEEISGWFRVWDVGAPAITAELSAPYTRVVAVLPGTSAVVTGGHAEVGVWSMPVQRGLLQKLDRSRDFRLWANLPKRHVPDALTFLGGRAGGRADHAAFIVAEYPEFDAAPGMTKYRLVLMAADGSGRIVREQPLWSGAPRIPAIASSPDGRLLAVAGNENNEILVYTAADLIAGRAEPQVLRGRGAIFRSVAFARKGDSLGLAFRSEPPRSPGAPPREIGARDLVFDVANRGIVAERAGWRTVAPDPGDWSAEVRVAPEGPARIVVRQGQRNIGEVRLEPESERDPVPQVTAFGLCPPTPHCKRPLLAVAVHVRGEPKLSIYLADTGEEVRRLTGHTERIPSLAFSADGGLLASAGEDRTIRVWSMVDLEKKTLGRHGIVRGLELRTDEQERLAVRGSVIEQLRVGDVITGVRAGTEELPLRTPWDFYAYVLNFAPGETVTVQVRRGDQSQPVQLPLVQATDERKPLFSLFVAPGEQPRQFAWIGWHPRGPYDASGPEAERSLGWHFNTGERDAPAKFAAAGEYRHLYYTRDLLRELVQRHEVPPPAPLPDAKMSLILRRRDGQVLDRDDYNDLVRVADGEVEAMIGLLNEFPAQSIAGVEWQFDDGEFRPAERSTERGWTADLSGLTWQRGFHTVRARLRTRELHPREFVVDEFLLFQPPPPPLSAGELPEQVKEAGVAATAEVAHIEQPVLVTLLHRHHGETVEEKSWTLEKPEKLREALELRAGENQVVWIATNRDAPEEYKERETARVTRVIRFVEPALPTLTLRRVEAQPQRGNAAAIEPRDAVYITEHPSIRLKGEIAAQAPLRKAAIEIAGESRPLTSFEPNAVETFTIDEPLTLTPGRQTVVIRAETADGASQTRAELEYRPNVPPIHSTTISPQALKPLPRGTAATNEVLYAGYHEPAVKLVAEFEPAEGPEFESHVILNGRELDDAGTQIDRRAGRLTATVPLQPGRNQIQVRMSNAWKRTSSGDAVIVHFKRPPRLKEIEAPAQVEQAFVELSAVAESSDDLPLRDVDIEVNGRAIADDLIQVEPANDERTEWRIAASHVPLDEGPNEIRLLAWNRDGSALEPLVHSIQMMAPPPPKPEVRILAPTNDQSISQRRVTVELAVDSESTVQRADLWVNGRAVPLPNIEKKAGYLRFSQAVDLENGKNEIRATATNAGGQSTAATCRVSCTPRPVTIEITRLGELVPEKGAGGQVRFSRAAPEPIGLLEGRVIIAEPDQFRELPKLVKVWVNGFQQPAIELKSAPAGPREFTFETEVVLNKPTRNRIEIMLPNLPRAHDASDVFYVDCDHPSAEQELHLLIVGVNAPDAGRLKEQAYAALQAEVSPDQAFRSSNAFARIIDDYGPLVGEVKTADVYRELVELHGILQSRRRAGVARINQVVMIYYQGKAVPDSRGERLILATSDNWDDPARDYSAITNEYLEGVLSDVFGAHLIALDVQREGPSDEVSTFLQSRSSPLGFIVVSSESEKVVQGAPFLTEAQGVIASSAQLGDFLQQLRDRFTAANRAREIDYEAYVHESLRSLNIGAKTGGGG